MRVIIRVRRKTKVKFEGDLPPQPAGAAASIGIDLRGVWCHDCGSRYIRLSRQRGSVDYFLSLIGYLPFRCYSCGRRFRFFAPKL
ncbi:MAG: hypothetical protein KIT09_26760 [Bryobacteraceae bacterium]|nr:hypothetical protein [Bryobacteraceae bacterium]